ncbi:MAG: hypothetical protein A4S09_09950 [Proteobacteria bacterium SG_bin7]|nr:MAG: hypothetical protein A4S09_09950 [Proteobacteria bacterium SG_bin7]
MFKSSDFDFHSQTFEAMLQGLSAIDIPRLNILNIEEAHRFLSAYGYQWENERDRDQLWSIHRQAVILLREVLLEDEEKIPDVLSDPNQLQHLGYLLVYASTDPRANNEFQRYSCALLRIMHVLVHLKNDLSSVFLDQIQSQITKPFKDHIVEVPGVQGMTLGRGNDQIKLYKFEVKPVKTSTSAVIKLLANRTYLVPYVMDRVGIRCVSKGVYDAFRVVRYLVSSNLVSFPNNLPDQARNTVYPTNLFLELMDELKKAGREFDGVIIEEALKKKLTDSLERAQYKEKYNAFSGAEYRSIKFINRRRISVTSEDGHKFSFFYPYEVQIMDHETYLKTLSGPMAHSKYKERQIESARKRVLGIADV